MLRTLHQLNNCKQFLSRQTNVPVKDFKNQRKGRAKDFSVDPDPFYCDFIKIPAVDKFISRINDCFTLNISKNSSPVENMETQSDDKTLEPTLSKLNKKINAMAEDISGIVNKISSLKTDQVSYRDTVVKGLGEVKKDLGVELHRARIGTRNSTPNLMHNMKLVAAKKSNKLIFSGRDDFCDDDDLNKQNCKCIEEVLTVDGFFGEFTHFFVDCKSGYFKTGIEFDSALDRENIWRNRFSFEKKIHLFIEPYLSVNPSSRE